MEHIVNDAKLYTLAYMNRENEFLHHEYDKDSGIMALVRAGDLAIREYLDEEEKGTGTLSDDPLTNAKYLFICSATMATRMAIEGGLAQETAFNASDLYIRACDKCSSIEEVQILRKDMLLFFTERVAQSKRVQVLSKPVADCVRLIEARLHEHIQIQELADALELSPNYLSTIFKKETGLTIADVIQKRRIECAKNMMRFSDSTMTEISEVLAFSSPAHFANTFKSVVGMTPSEYKKRFTSQVSKEELEPDIQENESQDME